MNYTELQYLVENRAFAKMASKTCSTLLFVYLIGSTLCVIPEGEYQIGPVFGPGPGKTSPTGSRRSNFPLKP